MNEYKKYSTAQRVFILLFNSKLWYNMYYKHTKKHKLELKTVREDVLKRRKELIGM